MILSYLQLTGLSPFLYPLTDAIVIFVTFYTFSWSKIPPEAILDVAILTNDPNMASSLQHCDNLPGTDYDAVVFTLSVLPPRQETVH